mgnify:CR=1 FL=1
MHTHHCSAALQHVAELGPGLGAVEANEGAEVVEMLHADPAERLLDLLNRLGDLARGVGVLDAQAALSPMLAREEPVKEEGADTTDVQETGWARSHANANTHDFILSIRQVTEIGEAIVG